MALSLPQCAMTSKVLWKRNTNQFLYLPGDELWDAPDPEAEAEVDAEAVPFSAAFPDTQII